MCSTGFKYGGHGRPGEKLDIVVGDEVCDEACCMGSGIVVLKYNAVQLLMPEIYIKKKEKSAFLFLNSVTSRELDFKLSILSLQLFGQNMS